MINYDGVNIATLRLECEFSNNIGPNKKGLGTGIVLTHNSGFVLLTNRHMVNHTLVDNQSNFELSKMFLWCRRSAASGLNSPPEKFEIGLSVAEIVEHQTADVAIIANIKLMSSGANTPHITPLMKESLAPPDFFLTDIGLADPCVFIGYPGRDTNNPWFDTASGLPIVRLANIAADPKSDFINDNIRSTHARLVAGLSFSGSSGSPILNFGGGYKTKEGYCSFPGAILPKLIGIMGGHWWHDNKQIPEMLRHTGLSYFISSLAILELFAKLDE